MKYYLTLKYMEPIEVEFKEGIEVLNAIANYIDCYGEMFIGLYEEFDLALEYKELDYIMFGDIDICQDLNTIHHLENCYRLNINTEI